MGGSRAPWAPDFWTWKKVRSLPIFLPINCELSLGLLVRRHNLYFSSSLPHSWRLQRYPCGLGTFGREHILLGSDAEHRKGRDWRRQLYRLLSERDWTENWRCSFYRYITLYNTIVLLCVIVISLRFIYKVIPSGHTWLEMQAVRRLPGNWAEWQVWIRHCRDSTCSPPKKLGWIPQMRYSSTSYIPAGVY